jgi:hypothetical protein
MGDLAEIQQKRENQRGRVGEKETVEEKRKGIKETDRPD